MDVFEEKLKNYMLSSSINAEHLTFQESCHSVEEAARAVNASPHDLVKNICFINSEGSLIVAIVKGEDRVSTTRIGKELNTAPPRGATPEEIVNKTGYICGGVPSFGYDALFLIDSKVMDMDIVYSGGGSEYSLVKISPIELQKANGGRVVRIRK